MVEPQPITGFTSRYADVNGVRLHYVESEVTDRGRPDRPTLILVHGWPQHHGIWSEVGPALAQDFHVIALDLRGHGWSEVVEPAGDAYDKRTLARDVEALIEHLGCQGAVLVGHDWGAFVSLLVASRRPDLTSGVVAVAIIAPWASVPARHLPAFAYQVVAGGPWGSWAHRALGQRFLRLVFRLGAGSGPRLGEVESYVERYRDRGRAAAGAAMYRRFLTREFGDVMRRRYATPATEVPILLLPGRTDAVLPPSVVQRAAGADNVTMRIATDAGHWVPEQAPQVVVDAVRSFIDDHHLSGGLA